MSETKRETWVFDEIGAAEGCPRVIDSDGNPICDLRGWGHLIGTGGLNLPVEQAVAIQDDRGHLISAAPDLLAACEAALRIQQRYARPESDSGYVESNRSTIQLLAAIAKAKGVAS